MPEEIGEVVVDVGADVSNLGQEVKSGARQIASSFASEVKQAMAKAGNKAAKSFTQSFKDSLSNARQTLRGFIGDLKRATQQMSIFSGSIALGAASIRTLGNALTLLGGIPALAILAGSAINLAGALAALPAAIGVAATAMATLRIATQGVSNALSEFAAGDMEDFKKAMKALTSNAQEAVRAIIDLKSAFQAVQNTVQQNFFKGLPKEIRQLTKTYIPILEKGLGKVATSLNHLAKQASETAQTPFFQGAVKRLMQATAVSIQNLKPAVKGLMQALAALVKAGAPLIEQFTKWIGMKAEAAGAFLSSAQGARWLQKQIDQALASLQTFIELIQNLAPILGSFISVLSDLAQWFNSLPQDVQTVIAKTIGWTAAVGVLMRTLSPLITVLARLPQYLFRIGKATASVIKWFAKLPLRIVKVTRMIGTFIGRMATAAARVTAAFARMVARATVWAATTIAKFIAVSVRGIARFVAAMTRVAAVALAKFAVMAARAIAWAATMAAQWLIAMGPIGWIIATVTALVVFIIAKWEWIKSITIKVWNAIANFFIGIWKDIKSWAIGVWTDIANFFVTAWNTFIRRWKMTFQAIIDFFVDIWKSIKSWAVDLWTDISNWFQDKWDTYVRAWKMTFQMVIDFFVNIWKSIKNWAVDLWNDISSFFEGALNSFVSFWQGIWNDISSWFQDIFGSIVDIAESIWKSVVSTFESWINKVIDLVNTVFVNPIQEVLGAFGVEIGLIPKVNWTAEDGAKLAKDVEKMASGGMFARIGAGFKTDGPKAVVGEGNPAYPEYVIPTDPKYRANARRLHGEAGQYMAGGGAVGMEGGGILDWMNPFPEAWNMLTDAISWLGEKAWGWIQNGLGWIMNTVVGPIVDEIQSALPDNLFGNTLSGMITDVVKWVRDTLGLKIENVKEAAKEQKEHMSQPLPGVGGAERWKPVVRRALQIVGKPMSLVDETIRQIAIESSGNPRAVNRWDINARLGHPSKGLLQTIGPTFRAYNLPRLGGIFDPLANIVAAMRYAIATYGSLQAVWPTSGGYAKGTSHASPGWHWVGENGPELMNFRGGEQVSPVGNTTYNVNLTVRAERLGDIRKAEDFVKMMERDIAFQRKTSRSGTVSL